uniref:Uncharacterized protein n=1 Tax=Sarcophilus harrisii TaxID=9305 RepID=A0A7N4PG77_SARHA
DFCLEISYLNTEWFIFILQHLPITFELGPALFWCPKEATFSKLLSHCPIYFALSMTGLKGFIKPRLTKNVKESLSFLIAPVYTCHQSTKLRNKTICIVESRANSNTG